MRAKKIFVTALLSVLYCFPTAAQNGDARQILNAAEEAYQIGQVEEAKEMLEDHVQSLNSSLRLRGYRLLSLCCLALEDQEGARAYALKMLQENPYYTPTVEYPPRFIDMVEDIKQGLVTTISIASSQSETVNEAPSPITIITAEMIEELGYNKNLNQILAAYVPGMTEVTSDSPGENMAMHGAYSNNQELILVMENGHQLNYRFNNAAIMSYNISIEKIDHIEVLRGPASSLYGNVAVSAVVNIITKSGRAIDGVKLRYGNGSYHTHRADLLAGVHFMDADITAWTSVYNSEGQIRHFNDGEGYYSNLSTHAERRTPDLRIWYGPDRIYVGSYRDTPSYDIGFTFRLKGFDMMFSRKINKMLHQTTYYSGYDYDLYPSINNIKPGFSTEGTHAEIGYTRQLGKFTLKATFYGDWNTLSDYSVEADREEVYSSEGEEEIIQEGEGLIGFENAKETTLGGYLNATTDYRLGNMKGNLLIGSQYEHFSLHSRLYIFGVDFESIDYGSFNYTTLFEEGKEKSLSFFLQDKHYILPELILNAGLRYDIKYHIDDHISSFSPRLALMYVPSNRFSLKLSYSQSYADLSFYYRFLLSGSTIGTEPLHLSALQLTAMGKLPSLHMNYEVSAFYNKYTHLIHWQSRVDNVFGASVNDGELTNIGIEGSANITYKRLTGNLTFYYCHDISSEDYYYNNSEKLVTGVPHVTLNLHGAYKLLQSKNHELKVYGNASYRGKMLNYTMYEKDDYYVSARMLFDLGMKYSYRERLQLSLDCDNIFNTDNYLCGVNSFLHPIFQRGRSLMASISYHF